MIGRRFEKSCYLKPSGSEISNRKRRREEEEEEKKKKKILPGVLTYHTAAKRIANVGVHVKPSEARYRGSNNRRLRRCPKLCFSQDARRRSREEKKRSEAEPRRSVDSEERDCDRVTGALIFFFLKGIITFSIEITVTRVCVASHRSRTICERKV